MRRIKKKVPKNSKKAIWQRTSWKFSKNWFRNGIASHKLFFWQKNNKGVDNIPNIFKYGVSKIKNKNLKKALNSDITDIIVDESQKKVDSILILYFKK